MAQHRRPRKEIPTPHYHIASRACVQCGREAICRRRLQYGMHLMCELPDPEDWVRMAVRNKLT